MPLFTKDSLETLRQRIDLVDVLSSHLDLKKSGASYKALCPFHDEKSPSFMVQKGDSHYHCFGCGAHGDAISFLMTHLKMGFSDSVEHLAQRYQVHLETMESSNEKPGPNKAHLKEALDHACRFFHFMLLHTPEGQEALNYLFGRDLDLHFIRQFQIGWAPKQYGMLRKILHSKLIKDETMAEAGLLAQSSNGGWRDFFSERIMFPIRDATGAVIGFSGRKFKESVYGGKYVNTPETALFKKSKILFGLNYARRRIAKESRVIIVEGQVDALRLIHAGFNIAVAGQGTAFGEGHIKELMHIGLRQAYLAMDADEAGQEATGKIGQMLQKEGVEVNVVKLPPGYDPDLFLRRHGADAFLKLMEGSEDFLSFLVRWESQKVHGDAPAGKNELVQVISQKIREWDQPLLVYESLRKLAHLLNVPEHLVGLDQIHTPNVYIRKSASAGLLSIDPDRILESDFLRWLWVMYDTQPECIALARLNIPPEALHVPVCRMFYQTYLELIERQSPRDVLSMLLQINHPEAQEFMSELMLKRINKERAQQQFVETMQKILDRNWMQTREEIKMKIAGGQYSDDETLAFVKQFEELKKHQPKLRDP